MLAQRDRQHTVKDMRRFPIRVREAIDKDLPKVRFIGTVVDSGIFPQKLNLPEGLPMGQRTGQDFAIPQSPVELE